MNWEQIKKHPFIVNNVDNFHFIELNKVKDIDSNQFEMNSKNLKIVIIYVGLYIMVKILILIWINLILI